MVLLRMLLCQFLCCGLIAQHSLASAEMPYRLHRMEGGKCPLPSPPDLQKGEFKLAFWNILVEFASEKEAQVYPQYAWKRRAPLVSGLIKRDAPDILGFCECNLIQAKDLSDDLEEVGYRIAGYSSEALMTLQEVQEQFALGNKVWYGEFVGFIYQHQRMELLELTVYPLPKGQRHARIVVEGQFRDLLTGRTFVVLASHFDHLLASSIEMSGHREMEILKELEEEQIPWFSVGDRNWPYNEQGEQYAREYVQYDFVREFRDDTLVGHYGPAGTFPGHLWLEKYQPLPPLIYDAEGQPMIAASTIDVGYRSAALVTSVASYTLSGEFSPDTFELFEEGKVGNLAERNFASDHYYIGGIFRLN